MSPQVSLSFLRFRPSSLLSAVGWYKTDRNCFCFHVQYRKIRCSGEQPACASCVHVGHDCHYSNAEDGRKAGAVQRSKLAQQRRVKEANGDEVHDLRKRNTVLRTRLIALERALSKRGVSITEALEESAYCQESALDARNLTNIDTPFARRTRIGVTGTPILRRLLLIFFHIC